MNPTHHIRRLAGLLTVIAGALLAVSASAPAFARPVPPGGSYAPGSGSGSPALVRVHTIVAGGMPGWQITLIAIGAALAAATLAVLVYRAVTARRHAAPATA
jgi:hypothetical protein